MCRYIYSLAACGHEFGAGMDKCDKYLAWEAEPDSEDISPQCRNPGPEPHDMQTYEGDCYMCKQEFECVTDAYTGKQRCEILKRLEHHSQAFEVMYENAERELQSAKEKLTRVRREAACSKKEAA